MLRSFGPFCLSLLLFLGKSYAFETWTLPIENELKTLHVSNLTSQPQLLWLSGPRKAFSEPLETSFSIPAYSTEEIPLNDFQSAAWIRLLSEKPKTFQIQISTSFDTQALLTSGSSTRWKVRTRNKSEIVVFNQAPFAQKVSVSTSSEDFLNLNLEAFEKKRIPIPPHWSGGLVTISGSARVGGFLISPQGPRAWLLDPTPVKMETQNKSSYFLLANKSASLSYIVALDDPKLIEQARKQISNPQGFLPRILLARVEPGHGEFNRDFSSSNKAPWSWHITQAYRFAELASQECDGNPELLEETLDAWMQGSGVICFWNYRVIKELSPAQISKGKF